MMRRENSNFRKLKDKHCSREAHDYTCMLVACVLPCNFYHASNSIEQGVYIYFQTQFGINKHINTHNIYQMSMCNAAIMMGIEDTLYQLIKYQVEMLL